MKLMRRVLTLLVSVLFAAMLVPAAAQDDEAAGPLDDLSQLEGIEAAVSRSWSIDFTAMMETTPESDTDDPFASSEGVLFLTGAVLEFDGDDNAESAFQLYRDEGLAEIQDSFEAEEMEVAEGEIDDLGDRAYGIDVYTSSEGSEGYFRYAIAQDGNLVFFVISVAGGQEANTGDDDVLEHLVNDGEASGEDEEFVAEGGSTGGLWGFFPDDDHEAIEGLIAGGDEVLFPIPDIDG